MEIEKENLEIILQIITSLLVILIIAIFIIGIIIFYNKPKQKDIYSAKSTIYFLLFSIGIVTLFIDTSQEFPRSVEYIYGLIVIYVALIECIDNKRLSKNVDEGELSTPIELIEAKDENLVIIYRYVNEDDIDVIDMKNMN